MKKILFLTLLLIITLPFLAGCSAVTDTQVDIDKPQVAATIFPLYDLARQIGGEKIEVQLILKPGTSPHAFEVTPSLIKDLQKTTLIFAIGHNLDDWASNLVYQNDKTRLVTVDNNINLKPFVKDEEESDEHHDDEDGHSHATGDIDPHYWLSPDNAIQIASNIKAEFITIDPDNASYYQVNLDNFIQKIADKKQEWKNKLAALTTKDIVVFHDGWSYFADYFGLNIVASFEEFPGKEPTPTYLINVGNIIKDKNIRAMFIEPQLSASSLNTLGKDMGVKLGTMDPLGGVSDRGTYIDLIDYNINSLLKNLQ